MSSVDDRCRTLLEESFSDGMVFASFNSPTRQSGTLPVIRDRPCSSTTSCPCTMSRSTIRP